MFFTETFFKVLFIGALLSTTGNDIVSEISDEAVAPTTERKSGVLSDPLVVEHAEQFGSKKSSVTASFVESLDHHANETSLQCVVNVSGIPFLVNNKTNAGKGLNQTLKWQNGSRFRTTISHNGGSSRNRETTLFTQSTKLLLQLDRSLTTVIFLTYLLCAVWKYQKVILKRFNIIKVQPKYSLPKYQIIQQDNFGKFVTLSNIQPQDTNNTGNRLTQQLPRQVRLGDVLTDKISESDDKSYSTTLNGSDDAFPDEFFLVGMEDGKVMLTEEDWEPIEPRDPKVRSREEEMKDTTIVKVKERQNDHPVNDRNQPNDLHEAVLSQTSDPQLGPVQTMKHQETREGDGTTGHDGACDAACRNSSPAVRHNPISSQTSNSGLSTLEGNQCKHSVEREGLVRDGESRNTSLDTETSVPCTSASDSTTLSLSDNPEEDQGSLIVVKVTEGDGLASGNEHQTSPSSDGITESAMNSLSCLSHGTEISDSKLQSDNVVELNVELGTHSAGDNTELMVSTIGCNETLTVIVQQNSECHEEVNDTLYNKSKVEQTVLIHDHDGEIRTDRSECPSTPAGKCQEVGNLVRMKNWKFDNLLAENNKNESTDGPADGEPWQDIINQIPRETTNDDDVNVKTDQYEITNGRLEKEDRQLSKMKIEECLSEDEDSKDDDDDFPDEFFVFPKPDDKTKSLIPIEHLPPDDVVKVEDKAERPSDFIAPCECKTEGNTIHNVGRPGGGIVLYDDVIAYPGVSTDDQGNIVGADVVESDYELTVEDILNCSEEEIWPGALDDDDDGRRTRLGNHLMAALIFTGTFVLPCFIAAKVLKKLLK